MASNGTATTNNPWTVPSGVARMNYFYGQLLTQRDLFTEQRYHLELRRLIQREAFGTGTVAGLRVESAGPTADTSVFVHAGLALDPDGRELLLVNKQCIVVADTPKQPVSPAPTTVQGPAAGTSWSSSTTNLTNALITMAAGVSSQWQAAFGRDDLFSPGDPRSLWIRLNDAGLTEVNPDSTASPPPDPSALAALATLLNQIPVPPTFSLKQGHLLRDVLFDQLVGTTYLGLQYFERGTDPSPTVLDASCCGNATCFPSRHEEGVVIVAQDHPFPELPDPYREALEKLSDELVQEENSQPPAVSSQSIWQMTDYTQTRAIKANGPDATVTSGPGAASGSGSSNVTGSPAPAAVLSPPVQLDCQKALCEVLLHAWRGLPAEDPCGTRPMPIVPLARVYWSRFRRNPSGQSRILSVDNCSRPLAPGVPPVRALLAALTQCTALVPTAPRFEHFTPPNHGQINVDSSTNPATVVVRATSPLAPITLNSWEVYYYPPYNAGSSTAPAAPIWSMPAGSLSLSQSFPSGGPTTTISVVQAPSSTNPKVTEVKLVFAASAGTNTMNFLPQGTYRWRLNVDHSITALGTSTPVEGILEGVFYVPASAS